MTRSELLWCSFFALAACLVLAWCLTVPHVCWPSAGIASPEACGALQDLRDPQGLLERLVSQ